MTNPPVEHRYELELTVPGTPEQVWDAIATADGIAGWMMPTELEPRLGGAVVFHMGPDPDEVSRGRVTAYEPTRRIAYEEDWAALVGQPGDDVTPLVTEFIVEAQSGGSCVVRVVSSAFGAGAEWEREFFDEMTTGWGPMLDNLRLYLLHFPGQRVESMWAGTEFAGSPEEGIAAVRTALGVSGAGDPVQVLGVDGRVERSIERHMLVLVTQPVPGFLSFFAFGGNDASGVRMQAQRFGDAPAPYDEREHSEWQSWFDRIASPASAERSGA
jgi:uncharacterized protein YndB with AHSA1/START domain